MNQNVLLFAYLVAAALFILGLRGLTHPSSARRGNILSATGMGFAIVATLFHPDVHNYGLIVSGVLVGAVIGTGIALRIKMTAMPQLVALLHSFVGLCAVLVALGTYANHLEAAAASNLMLLELSIGTLIGAITFTGSLVAFGKLQAILPGRPLLYGGRHAVNLVLALLVVVASIYFVQEPSLAKLVAIAFLACLLGILLITPIGGVDMPVIVSMLNSYSGWAAAATGFTLQNPLLMITGAIVGFSGAILSYIMCRAMNRSFISVLLGGFGKDANQGEAAATDKPVRAASVEDAAFLIENASNVIVVPGYGMAVAQAQHALNELRAALQERGIDVKFAIHPVAGRMPGHMNVLLAEADVPYEQVIEMEEINPEFAAADVALVVGANDVTNPAAKSDAGSPIYGMPILEVFKARQILFVKRSMNAGYSGVDNELFYRDNCSLVFGDAKKVCESVVSELRAA